MLGVASDIVTQVFVGRTAAPYFVDGFGEDAAANQFDGCVFRRQFYEAVWRL